MKLEKFLESLYLKTHQDLLNDDNNIFLEAKRNVTKDILDVYKFFIKKFYIFNVLIHFVLVKLHLVKPPKTREQMIEDANKAVNDLKEKQKLEKDLQEIPKALDML